MMQHEQTGLLDTSYEETPLLGNFMHSEEKQTRLEKAKAFIKARFPNVDLKKLPPRNFSKHGAQTEIVSFGPKGMSPKFSRLMAASFSKASQTYFQVTWSQVLSK